MNNERYKDHISPEVVRLQKAGKPVPSLDVKFIKLADIETNSASWQVRLETVVYNQNFVDNISIVGIQEPIIVIYDEALDKYICVTGHNRVVNVQELNVQYPDRAAHWGLTECIPAYVYETELSPYLFQVCGNIANDHPITNPFKQGDIFKTLTLGITTGDVEDSPAGLRTAIRDMKLASVSDNTINKWVNKYIEGQNKDARLIGNSGTIYIPSSVSDHARACNFITQQGKKTEVYENGVIKRLGKIQAGNIQWVSEHIGSMVISGLETVASGNVIEKLVLGLILTDISSKYDALPRDIALEKTRLDVVEVFKYVIQGTMHEFRINEIAFLPQFQSIAGQAFSDDIVTYKL
jgi:hypothetical protein